MIPEVVPSKLALPLDHHLEVDTILPFMFKTLKAQKFFPTQTLDTPTAHHLATVIIPLSPSHSWRVVKNSILTKWKSSMKALEEIKEFGILALHTLHDKN